MKLFFEAGDVTEIWDEGDPKWPLVLKQIPPLHSLPLSLVASVSLLALKTLGEASFFLTLGDGFLVRCLSAFVGFLGVELFDLGVVLFDFTLSLGGEKRS